MTYGYEFWGLKLNKNSFIFSSKSVDDLKRIYTF